MFEKILKAVLISALVVGSIGCDLITGKEETEEENDPWAGTSTITVNSDPSGANVYLDDSLTGLVTPCILERCKYGDSYDLKLTHSEYLDWETIVHLEGGQDHPVVDAVLIAPDGSSVEIEAAAELTSNGYGCKYKYKFNVDFTVVFFAFQWPEHDAYYAYKTIGFCQAEAWNTSHEFGSSTGERIPIGTHKLLFAGTDDITEQQCFFDIQITASPGGSQSVKVKKLSSIPEQWSPVSGNDHSPSVIVVLQ